MLVKFTTVKFLKKFLEPDPDEDEFHNLIMTILFKVNSLVKFS